MDKEQPREYSSRTADSGYAALRVVRDGREVWVVNYFTRDESLEVARFGDKDAQHRAEEYAAWQDGKGEKVDCPQESIEVKGVRFSAIEVMQAKIYRDGWVIEINFPRPDVTACEAG